jgi:transcription initiation factor IIE alpha subunit
MNEILLFLKKHGECLDSAIASATGIALIEVRLYLSELAENGEITVCHTIRYENGVKVEGMSCRIAGYIPYAKPTREKTKPRLDLCR